MFKYKYILYNTTVNKHHPPISLCAGELGFPP